jgi:hypothetical protein
MSTKIVSINTKNVMFVYEDKLNKQHNMCKQAQETLDKTIFYIKSYIIFISFNFSFCVSNCPGNMSKYYSTKYHSRNLHEV